VDCVERLSIADTKKRTAGHVTDLDPDLGFKLRKMRDVFTDLTVQAESLYDGSVKSPRTGMVSNWALELRAPKDDQNVANWENIANLNLNCHSPLHKGPTWGKFGCISAVIRQI
jgi:hypothetical protein